MSNLLQRVLADPKARDKDAIKRAATETASEFSPWAS